MKTTKILLATLVLGLFISFNAMAGNEGEEKPSSLVSTEWVSTTKGENGTDCLMLTFQTDSTCSVLFERFTKRGEIAEIRSLGKYEYNYPDILFTVRVHEVNLVLTKGIFKDGKIEVFKEDQTSFIMERKQNKK